MQGYARVSRWLSIISVLLLNLIQLFQVISFLKHTSKHSNWGKSIDSLISTSKSLSLRSAREPFITLYILSVSLLLLSLLLYIIFYNLIHKVNKVNKASKANSGLSNLLSFTYVQYFIEYFIFGLGFIPMVSKLIEVQVCDLDLNIDSYSSISCFDSLQMALVQVGFIGCGAAYFFNAVIIPTLKYEREGLERMWSRESYFEGLYYLVLFASVSFMNWVHKPWIGVLLCGLVFLYGLVYECYETLTVACSRCGVLASLLWVFTSAHMHDSDSAAGELLFSLLPLAYISGFAVKLLRHKLNNFLPARWNSFRC